MTVRMIITQGPYSSSMNRWQAVEGFAGLRLNTVMPVPANGFRERLEAMREASGAQPLWVDLKTRQLRVRAFANTPYTAVTITHRVTCRLPTTVYFDNGRLTGRLVDIDGYRLILDGYAGRLIGPGESVNVPDSDLKLLDSSEGLDGGLFTGLDLDWLEACRELGIHHYMLSFVESGRDMQRLRERDPKAVVMAKVESRRGLRNIEEITQKADWVMAARGDLYVEVAPPHAVDAAVRRIIEAARERAVVGSRILESLLGSPVPSLADLADLHRLRDMGVPTVMVGDDLCFDDAKLFRALRILQAVWDAEDTAWTSSELSSRNVEARNAHC